MRYNIRKLYLKTLIHHENVILLFQNDFKTFRLIHRLGNKEDYKKK